MSLLVLYMSLRCESLIIKNNSLENKMNSMR
jgi:hypothetical protein